MTTLKIKRGPSGNLTGITPAEGELVFVTNTKELRVGDGSTVGAANLSVNKASVADTANAVAGANVSGTVSSANNSSYLGGVAAAGYAQLSGATFTGNVSANRFVSTVATGTAPLVVTSTTEVANLKAATANAATFAATVTGGTQANIATLGNVNLQLASSSTSNPSTRYLLMQTVNGGTAKLESAVGITANAANSSITATTFIGNVTGNVTGNLSGTATYATTANAVAGANVSGVVANATYAVTSGVSNSVAGANVSGVVANATYAVTAGSTTLVSNGTSNVTIPSANGNVTINAGNLNAYVFDTTGNLTLPADGRVGTTAGNITIEGDVIKLNMRVGGELDIGTFPVHQQTGWYYNVNYVAGSFQWSGNASQSIFNNLGSAGDLGLYYLLVPSGSTTVGSPVVSVDTANVFYNGNFGDVVNWDSAFATAIAGMGVAFYDIDFNSGVPSSTIFPAGTTVQSVDIGAGTITMSANAVKATSNFTFDIATMISSPANNFYVLVGDNGDNPQGKIMTWSLPMITAAQETTYLSTGWGGPFLASPPAGNTLTYSGTVTWTTYPELRDADSSGTWRGVDVNTVNPTLMSYNRFNSSIVIAADATGAATGLPTLTGRADNTAAVNGLSLINTGLDTRHDGTITSTALYGTIPPQGVNVLNYQTLYTNASADTQRQTREREGPQMNFIEGTGNINTAANNLYARQYQGGGGLRWSFFAGSQQPNTVTPMASVTARAESDFTAIASNPTSMYLQYTPTSQGWGQPRTFLRAVGENTTVNGTSVSLRPLANKAPVTVYTGTSTSETARRNFLRELNATQDQVWLQASYYGGGGNANAASNGTSVAVRSDARVGNVALQIGRNSISSMSAGWISGGRTTKGQYISYSGNYYEATATNTTGSTNYYKLGTTAPTHTSGTVTNGNTSLTYIGSTAAEGAASYELIIKSAETDLTLYDKNNSANIATFNNARAAFAVPVQFPVYTAAGKPASGVVGQQICISDSASGGNPNGMMAFWDTTNNRWSYIHDNGAV